MKVAQTMDPIIIGWREYVDFPEWGLEAVRAKADTGARSSAIDVSHLEELPDERVRFEVVAKRGKRGERHTVEAAIVRRASVKSSFGATQYRLFVETMIRVAGREIRTQIGLVNREKMRNRVLLGRLSLETGFLVDSGRSFIHDRPAKSEDCTS